MIALSRFRYFLGGNDLEMAAIRALLARYAPGLTIDRKPTWSTAKASLYSADIMRTLARGETPVLIELRDDLPKDFDRKRVLFVDHHGLAASAEAKTSLDQIVEHLRLRIDPKRNRWFSLVSANDRGHIDGLKEFKATLAEIVTVRTLDRRAQGVSLADEQQARNAIRLRQVMPECDLTVVRIGHRRASAVADFIDPIFGGPGASNLLTISPDEVNFSGEGRLVTGLTNQFPDGWYGGRLPERGYWGHGLKDQKSGNLSESGVLQFLRAAPGRLVKDR